MKVFGVKEAEIMYFKDMPEDPDFPVTAEMAELVLHGSININGDIIMFSDSPSEMGPPVIFGNNITLMYSSTNLDELRNLFEKLSDKGKIIMPFAETFWSKGYGYLIDKYDVGWQLNFEE